MASRAVRDYEILHREITSDIFKLCQALRFTPTSTQQAPVLKAIQDGDGGRNFISVKSGQGPGKSALAVIAALFRSLRHAAPVVLTAPTQRQCRESFLARAAEILAGADPMLRKIIEITATGIKICGDRRMGVHTVTASKDVRGQGEHHPGLSIIADEASGCGRRAMEQFHGTLSNHNALFLLLGNPNAQDCYFYDTFYGSMSKSWQNFTFNAEDTARYHPEIVSPSRNQELEEQYGRDSDVYRIRVLGEFPLADPTCAISRDALMRCTETDFLEMSRLLREENGQMRRARQFGLDFARHGGDELVLYQRIGEAILEEWIGSHTEPDDLVARAFRMQMDSGWHDKETWYVPDAGGMGQGVLSLFAQKPNVVEFHTQGVSGDAMFANKMTEAYFNVARKAKAGKIWVPNDQLLIHQLSSRKYTTRRKDGKLILWDKDAYMKEGNDSPDRADAFVMAHYDSQTVGGRISDPVKSSELGEEMYNGYANVVRQHALARRR